MENGFTFNLSVKKILNSTPIVLRQLYVNFTPEYIKNIYEKIYRNLFLPVGDF